MRPPVRFVIGSGIEVVAKKDVDHKNTIFVFFETVRFNLLWSRIVSSQIIESDAYCYQILPHPFT